MISRQGLRAIGAWIRGKHAYYSTGCRHGQHAYCQGALGQAGPKKPGECKFCSAKCICWCHREVADAQRNRPTGHHTEGPVEEARTHQGSDRGPVNQEKYDVAP